MRSNGEHAPAGTAHGRFDAAGDTDRIAIQVWGDRYIDDAAIRGESTDLTNDDFGLTLEKTRYYATDALFSTVALLDSDGDLLERVRYTPYGEARHWKAADLDGDGDVDDDDKDILWDAWGNSSDIADAAYNADADINRDGTVDGTDDGIRLFSIGPALPAGQISEVDNPIGYAGYVFNAADATYLVRNRCYEPEMGRWLERDPLGFVDGLGLYEYTTCSPTNYPDPFGLLTGCAGPPPPPPSRPSCVSSSEWSNGQQNLQRAILACRNRRITVECKQCNPLPGGGAPCGFVPTGTTEVTICSNAPAGCSETIGHEWVHVEQNCSHGGLDPDNPGLSHLCRELEAYSREPGGAGCASSQLCLCNRACSSTTGALPGAYPSFSFCVNVCMVNNHRCQGGQLF